VKIFVIHAEAGSGHKKIAEGIQGFLDSKFPDIQSSIFDILHFTPFVFKELYSKGYIFMISRLKWLWGFFFYSADTKWLSLINVGLRKFVNRIFCRRFLGFITKEEPEIIISTHFLVNELVSYLKGKKLIKTKLISMVTDYGVHRFWIANNVDLYLAGCNKTREILMSKGIENEKIQVWGIPIREQFKRELNKVVLRKKLSIPENSFVSLIVTGGIGLGPIEKIVREIEDKKVLIVICGTNKKLQNKLENLNFKNLNVFGWVDNIEELMVASDIVITKPGGSTISECLYLNLPMIFFSVIPGQEANNAKIMNVYGICEILEDPKLIGESVQSFSKNPQKYNKLKQNISQVRRTEFYDKLAGILHENQ